MTVAFVTASASRQAGGLFDALRRLAVEAARLPDVSVMAFALEDAHSAADRGAWDVPLTIAPTRGPRPFGYAPQLLGHLNEAQPDLVHQHGLWMYPSVACGRWSSRAGRPYVVSPHGMLDPWAVRNSRWKKRVAGWLYEDAHLRRAACLHALCEAEARAMRAYGLKNPVCVIPNGVDLPRDAARRDDSGARTVLYLGRLHPKKNILNLLRAWALVQREAAARRWQLVIAGWDQHGHGMELERVAGDLLLTESVRFAGPQFGDDKQSVFRKADAVVLPSHSEGLPITVLEAWSYGLPVLMTPQCNLPQGFQVGAAVRIEVDAAAIASGLFELVSMTDVQRRVMGERGLALVKRRFQWPEAARQMKAVYEWVLGGARPTNVEIFE